MPELSFSSPSTWPWWLWAEHGILLGALGWKAASIWRAHCRRNIVCTGCPPPKAPDVMSNNLESLDATISTSSSAIAPTNLAPAPTPKPHALEKLSEAVLSNLEAIKHLSGPREVLTWPDVVEAPAASMDTDGLSEGQAATYRDGRGAIYKFKLRDDVFVNMYFTRAGYRRSGDLHDCNQYDVVLAGRTRLRMIDPHSGREVVQEYGPNDFIVIPARTPHMFEFLEDNCLLEWWDAPFRAWYYRPYRAVIEQGGPLEATQGRDFSVNPPQLPQQ